MKSVAALLLALVTWTGSLGTLSVVRCAMASARCEARPCCKPKGEHGQSLKPRMSCCDGKTTTSSPAPAATLDSAVLLVALPPSTATLSPIPDGFASFARVAAPLSRGPPLYLRNRSLLL